MFEEYRTNQLSKNFCIQHCPKAVLQKRWAGFYRDLFTGDRIGEVMFASSKHKLYAKMLHYEPILMLLRDIEKQEQNLYLQEIKEAISTACE